jgi:hypothetical protein
VKGWEGVGKKREGLADIDELAPVRKYVNSTGFFCFY